MFGNFDTHFVKKHYSPEALHEASEAEAKIAAMMAPIFSSDPVKERSLYCCADCKPKIMMQSYFDQKNQGLNNAR